MTAGTAIITVPRLRMDRLGEVSGERSIPVEVPIALTFDRATHAVMMASPVDLEDFAVGFSLSERIIDSPAEITELNIVPLERGIELRLSLSSPRNLRLEARRRSMAGPAGCGMCGLESLSAAVASPPPVGSSLSVGRQTVFAALRALEAHQTVNAKTRAVHAAGFWSMANNEYTCVREDVGRHNALDKLLGALARSGESASHGFIVMTSRVSIELVQKTATAGCPMLVAVSAPTSFAVEAASAANLTLVAIARDDSFEVFSHPERLLAASDVA